MNGLQMYLDKILSVFEKRSEDFTYINIDGDQMPIQDYIDDSIPKERVILDTEKIIAILHEAKENLSGDDFLILLAAYCNYYIEEGIIFRINQEQWGLSEFFSTNDDKDIAYLVCDGVVRQDYSCFDRILELDKNCTVANVYLFVKYMSEVTYLISINDESVDRVEKKAWNYYEQLSQTWKQYVIQEKEEYPFEDKSPIPYIFCGKRETSHFEDMLIGYTKSILEKLSIQDFEPEELYNLIQEKYHVMDSYKPLNDFALQNNFTNKIDPTNLTQEQKDKINEDSQGLISACSTMAMESIKGLENRAKTQIDMIYLFEKLGYLVQMTDQDRKEQHRFEIFDFPEEEDSLLYRYEYVHIPVVTCESISMRQLVDRYRLFSVNCALENKITAIRQMNTQRAKMVNQLEHSWGNESYPEIVKDVADSLNKQNKNDLANKLFMAYESENMMMGQIIILQALMSENPGELKRTFKDSFFESGKEKLGYKIDEIFSGNLNRLISNLINSKMHSSKKKRVCREKLSVKYCIEDIVKKYSDFQANDSENSIFDWFNNNIFNMKFIVDEEWMKVNFGLTQNGRIIFENILMELFTNVLFHGKEYCNIRLFSEDEKYKIEIRNGIDNEKHGSQKGLEAMGCLIDKLNFDTNVLENEGLVYRTINDNCFVTTITLAKELMYLEGWVL